MEHHRDTTGAPDIAELARALRERTATITARLDAYHLLDAEVRALLDTLVSRTSIALDLFAALQRDAQRITALQDALNVALGRSHAVAEQPPRAEAAPHVRIGPPPALSELVKGEIRRRLSAARVRGSAAYDAEREALRAEFGAHLTNARLAAYLATAGDRHNGSDRAADAHGKRRTHVRDMGTLTEAHQCEIRLMVLRALASKHEEKVTQTVREMAEMFEIGEAKVRAVMQLVLVQPAACAIAILAHLESLQERRRVAKELAEIAAALEFELPDPTLLLQRALEYRHALLVASEA